MPRTLITAPLTIYVDTVGNDGNDGLTPVTAVATLERAWSRMANDFDLQGIIGNAIQLTSGTAAAPKVYAPLQTNVGCVGQAGYDGVRIQGGAPNDNGVIVDGGASDAFVFGASSGCGVQAVVQNLSIKSAGVGLHVFGGGNGVIGRNITFPASMPGAAICCEHNAEAAFQNYIYFLGASYGVLAQAVTGGQFTGGESAVWAIGVSGMTITRSTLFCADAKMNLGGLVSVNPRLLSGHQVGNDGGKIRTGGGSVNIPGSLGTAIGAPYNVNGGFID